MNGVYLYMCRTKALCQHRSRLELIQSVIATFVGEVDNLDYDIGVLLEMVEELWTNTLCHRDEATWVTGFWNWYSCSCT